MATVDVIKDYIGRCKDVLAKKDAQKANDLVTQILFVFDKDISGSQRNHLSRYGFIGAASFNGKSFIVGNEQDDLRDLELLCASLELELEKKENDVKVDNHSGISIYGNATNVQIQQDTTNSTQTQHIESTTVDFDKAGEIIDRIRTYQSMFDSEFGDRSQELSETLNEASDAIEKKEHGRLKRAWSSIKAIMENAGGSLIAAGILEALNSLPALLQGV